LIENYHSIVRRTALVLKAKLPGSVDADDLYSAGIFGLVQSLHGFDPNRGIKFETYCLQRIRGAMLDELRDGDWVPRLVRKQASELATIVQAFRSKNGREPTTDELAEKLGVPHAEVETLLDQTRRVEIKSIDRKQYETGSGKEVTEIMLVPDKQTDAPGYRQQQLDVLRAMTRGLGRNERLIIILYYFEQLTMKEIGATLNLSESRVSQMHSALIARLRITHAEKMEDVA
jgi:RNA polymerase sigma factor for flagellar operon FliA